MIIKWIEKMLQRRIDKKKYEVMRLQWEKVRLERQLKEIRSK